MMSNLFFGILTWKMLRKKVRILISMKQKHLERILKLVKTNIMTNSNNFCNRNLKTDSNQIKTITNLNNNKWALKTIKVIKKCKTRAELTTKLN